MADTFVTKIRLQERAANQRHWAGKIKQAITNGMSHKGDMLKRYAKIVGNVTDVANEMEEQARKYDKNNQSRLREV